jgi:hypothetical protein
MQQTHDYLYTYPGYGAVPSGPCRVRIFEAPDENPVIICTQPLGMAGTSITNLAEYLAADLIARHFPDRLDSIGQSVVWVEHYARQNVAEARKFGEFAFVSFAPWRPTRTILAGIPRRTLGRPSWQYASRLTIEDLLGQSLEAVTA